MNKFERILLKYGSAVFCVCFHIAESKERYEDCAEMKLIAEKRGISLNGTLEDWQVEFWRLGMSGETAIANAPVYLEEALKQIGYIAINGTYKARAGD